MATISTITNKLDIIFSGSSCESYVQFSTQQGDIKSRLVEANLFVKLGGKSCRDSLVPYDATGKTVVSVYEFQDRDGITKLTPEIECQVDQSKITFTIPNAPLAQAGIVSAQIKVYDSSNNALLHSALFMFEVLRTLGAGDVVDDNIPILLRLIQDVRNLNNDMTAAEQSREQAEGAREIAEAARQNATNTAVQNANNAAQAATDAANLVPNQILADAQQATHDMQQALTNSAAATQNANNAANEARTAVAGLDANLDSKVDKVAGKGLSTNDYTNTEKAQVAKIAGLETSLSTKADSNHTHSQYATLESPSFTGTPLAPTPTLPSSIATKEYVDNATPVLPVQMRYVNQNGEVSGTASENKYLQIYHPIDEVWEWVTMPSLNFGVEMRTTLRATVATTTTSTDLIEVPIYTKTINIGNLPAGTIKAVSYVDLSERPKIVPVDVQVNMIRGNVDWVNSFPIATRGSDNMWLDLSTSHVRIQTNGSWTNYHAVARVYYARRP